MKHRRSVLLGCLAIFASMMCVTSCVSTSAMLLGEQRFAPRPVDHRVLLFDTVADVPRDYVKVARIVGTGSDSVSWDRVVVAMQERAVAVGADALVLGRETNAVESDGECVSTEKRHTALAIRWLPDLQHRRGQGSGKRTAR